MNDSSDPRVRRRRFLTALGVVGAGGLAGCISTGGSSDGGNGGGSDGGGSSGGGSGTGTGGGSGSQMAGSAQGWGWNIAARALQGAAETYNEEKGADVSVKEMGGDTWEQRFQTAVTSGTGAPDFSVVQNYDVTAFGSKNGLMDLTSRIDEADVRDDIVDGKWQTVSVDGKDYALPWDIGPTGVFYKRDRYETAGIDPESLETWDDFIEAGKQMPDDVAMINIPAQDSPQLWRMLFRQLGGQPFTEDGAVSINSEESVRALQLIKDMKDAGITRRIETWSGGWFTAFSEGTLASVATAAWMDGTLRAELPDTAGNWGVYKLPAFEKGGNRASNRGGSNMAIPSQISDEATVNRAWDYIEYAMTTPEVQNTMLEEFGLFPSLTTAYDADIYDQELDFYDGQPVFRLFAEVAQDITPYRYTTDTPEVQDAMNTEIGRMLDGAKSPEKAAQAAAQTVADRTDREVA
ncbi:sugar ABC transporter substrate-binding protein [Halogeometricum sp. S1BR25-6]|uniref:Sugar ABC transporter substrate-binding protein n=1 Tax=Halogeometricum salsisoli TaxID=2950536 RepID=A0ABU2GL11_9EURY|nr:sugar ABC transporter substrate-binding protein [Halogeometricum sp. S1BR25-6]MDS0300758.1 sugar ABC transporter substrate-binding protein [Halogeometricum sp. S1BR25-6]